MRRNSASLTLSAFSGARIAVLSFGTSAHFSGYDTDGVSLPRIDQVQTVVLLRSFCDQSMKTFPRRLALDMSETTRGSSSSMVIAMARASDLVSLKLMPLV